MDSSVVLERKMPAGRRVAVAGWPIVIGIPLAAAACHPERALIPQSIGVSRRSGGNPVLDYVLCPGEFMRRVQFFEREEDGDVAESSDDPLWELVVEQPPSALTEPTVSKVTVADPMVGYIETTALSSGPSSGPRVCVRLQFESRSRNRDQFQIHRTAPR